MNEQDEIDAAEADVRAMMAALERVFPGARNVQLRKVDATPKQWDIYGYHAELPDGSVVDEQHIVIDK